MRVLISLPLCYHLLLSLFYYSHLIVETVCVCVCKHAYAFARKSSKSTFKRYSSGQDGGEE